MLYNSIGKVLTDTHRETTT